MLRTPQPLGIARMLVERQKPLKSGPRPLLVLARRVERAAPIGLVHRQMPCGIMVGGTRRSSGITLAAEKLGGGEQRRDEKGFGRRPRMPGRIGDPPCGEVAGTAQEGLPSGRIVAARPAGRADRQREIVHRLPHRNRIGRRPALRSDIVPHAKPLPVERRPRQEIERPLHHRVHTDRIDPERTEMLEEITRRGGLSAPPHHDRPPRRGIHVESSDRTLVDPARTRHEAFRRHDLLEARQPLARKRRIQLQRPMDRPPESCTAQWRGIDRQPELLLDHRPRSNGQVLTGQLQTPLLERFAGPRTTIVADRSRQQQQFGMPVRLPHAERPPVIRITRIGERAGQRKERCCRATFAAFDLERSERHRIAVFFEKGELAGPAFVTHDIVGRIARTRRIAVVEDPRQKRPHRTWGQLPPDTERHRIERRTFRPLVTTDAMQQIVLDAVSVAQQPPAAAAGQFARKDRPLARPFACHGTYMPPLGRSPVAPCRSDRPQPLRRRRHDELATEGRNRRNRARLRSEAKRRAARTKNKPGKARGRIFS